jgi:hypothetical protein
MELNEAVLFLGDQKNYTEDYAETADNVSDVTQHRSEI